MFKSRELHNSQERKVGNISKLGFSIALISLTVSSFLGACGDENNEVKVVPTPTISNSIQKCVEVEKGGGYNLYYQELGLKNTEKSLLETYEDGKKIDSEVINEANPKDHRNPVLQQPYSTNGENRIIQKLCRD